MHPLTSSRSFTRKHLVLGKLRRLKSADSLHSLLPQPLPLHGSALSSVEPPYADRLLDSLLLELVSSCCKTHQLLQLDFDDLTRLYASLMPESTTAAMIDGSEEMEEDVEAAFDVYDSNGDGTICAAELASVLRSLDLIGADDTVGYCQSLIDRFDINGDGVVDLNEFRAMLRSNP